MEDKKRLEAEDRMIEYRDRCCTDDEQLRYRTSPDEAV
jgi:hypothetical protein